ncbi:MAG: invasion associated locus B family protein [Alphaproteobacteria bacterium]|nr:invasion associated locus B family protein [Alphaproteobacteria bacterium]
MNKFSFFAFLAVLMGFSVAQAATPSMIGEYGDWVAYAYKDASGQVCYMASTPKKDEGKYTKRGDIYVVVTHRPKEKVYDVVNFVAGYTFKSGEKVTVKIGTKTIDKLFTEGDKAWAINETVDKELVTAMKRGDRMFISGTSAKGTVTKDTYSLSGFMSAYKAISTKCK